MPPSAEEQFAWAVEACRKTHVRLTPVRKAILRFLSEQHLPVTLHQIAQAEEIRGNCDATTVYRSLMLFLELEVTRHVGLPDKASYFVLNVPGNNTHVLICRRCGKISALPNTVAIACVQNKIADDTGYCGLYHDLEFFGVCPECQKRGPRLLPSKLSPTMRHLQRLASIKKGNAI